MGGFFQVTDILMERRTIDIGREAGRRNPDNTWMVYANKLLETFGDITRRAKIMPGDFTNLYVRQRLRPLDEQIMSSLVFSVPTRLRRSRFGFASSDRGSGR